MGELWPGGPLELPHTFTVDGHSLTIRDTPAPTLLSWLARGAWWNLFLLAIEPAEMLPLVLRLKDEDDDFEYDHLAHMGIPLLGRMTGMATVNGSSDGYWPGVRIAVSAMHSWPLYAAWCAQRGTAPHEGPLHQMVTSMHGWLIDRNGEEGYEKLQLDIYSPPPYATNTDPDAVPPHILESEAAMAMASLGQEAMFGEEIVTEWTPPAA